MAHYKEIISVFPKSREEKLRSMKRFSMTDVFFYRSSLWHHALRVHFIVNELTKIAQGLLPQCDWEKASILALVHDDAEMITGDVQLGHKQVMTKEQLKEVRDNELAANQVLAQELSGNVGGYSYRELLQNALEKDCIEAEVVSYADKFDAYCESMHEVLAGNLSALRAVINYVATLENFKGKYPSLASLLNHKDSPLTNVHLRTDMWHVHQSNYVWLNRPHTSESIRQKTEFVFYNVWKQLVLDNLGQEGLEVLTNQVEKP